MAVSSRPVLSDHQVGSSLLFDTDIAPSTYLVDTDETNGSTEVWLGTHRDANFADHRPEGGIKLELLEKRRAVRPPVRLNGKKGDLVIRDPRLWHAGVSRPHNLS